MICDPVGGAVRELVRARANEVLTMLSSSDAPVMSAHARLRLHALLERLRSEKPADSPDLAELDACVAAMHPVSTQLGASRSFWECWDALNNLRAALQTLVELDDETRRMILAAVVQDDAAKN